MAAWDLGAGALFGHRLFDFLIADALQLLVLRRGQDLLQLRRGLVMDGLDLLHFLHAGQRGAALDCLNFRTLFLQERQDFELLLRGELKLLRQGLHFCRLSRALRGRGGRESQKRQPKGGGG